AAEPLLFACWVLVPLLFFTLNQSKLPQYVLPLVPAVALAATRNLAVLGAALLALPRWLPVPLALTPAEKAAIPPAAAALGAVTLASAALVAVGAWRGLGRTTLAGYAAVVIAIPFASGRLLAAVGDDRSAAALAAAVAAALGR